MPSALWKTIVEQVLPSLPHFVVGDNKTSQLLSTSQVSTVFNLSLLAHVQQFAANGNSFGVLSGTWQGLNAAVPPQLLAALVVPSQVEPTTAADGTQHSVLVDWVQSSLVLIEACAIGNQVAALALRQTGGQASSPLDDWVENAFFKAVTTGPLDKSELRQSWLQYRLFSSPIAAKLLDLIPGGIAWSILPQHHPDRVGAWLRLVAQPVNWTLVPDQTAIKWKASPKCSSGGGYTVLHQHAPPNNPVQDEVNYKWALTQAGLGANLNGLTPPIDYASLVSVADAIVRSWSAMPNLDTPNNEAFFVWFEDSYKAALNQGNTVQLQKLRGLQVGCFLPNLRKQLAIMRHDPSWQPPFAMGLRKAAEQQWEDLGAILLHFDLTWERSFYNTSGVSNAAFWFGRLQESPSPKPYLDFPHFKQFWAETVGGMSKTSASQQVLDITETIALGGWLGYPAFVCKNSLVCDFAWPFWMQYFSGEYSPKANFGKKTDNIWPRSPFATTKHGATPTYETWWDGAGVAPASVKQNRERYDRASQFIGARAVAALGARRTAEVAFHYFQSKGIAELASYFGQSTLAGLRYDKHMANALIDATRSALIALHDAQNSYFWHGAC